MLNIGSRVKVNALVVPLSDSTREYVQNHDGRVGTIVAWSKDPGGPTVRFDDGVELYLPSGSATQGLLIEVFN